MGRVYPALRATSTLVNIPPGPGATSASDDVADGSTCSPHLLHISFSRDHELQQRHIALSQTYSRSFSECKQGSLPRRECKVDGKTRDVPTGQGGLPADSHARRPAQGPSELHSSTMPPTCSSAFSAPGSAAELSLRQGGAKEGSSAAKLSIPSSADGMGSSGV